MSLSTPYVRVALTPALSQRERESPDVAAQASKPLPLGEENRAQRG